MGPKTEQGTMFDLESKWIDDGVSGRCGHAGQVWEEEAKGKQEDLFEVPSVSCLGIFLFMMYSVENLHG